VYECKYCEFTSESEKGVKIHTSSVHKDSQKKSYTCESCGSQFEDYPSRREGRGREKFYCSKTCKHSDEEVDKIDASCSWCSSEIEKYPSSVGEVGEYSIDNHFCNKECESEWKSFHWTGKNHPSWEGGHTNHYGENWNEERRNALDAAEYKCKLCGQTREEHYGEYGFDLDVHHRIPVSAFDNVENANFQDNLVVCCRNCHQSKLEREPVPHNELRAPA